MTMHDILDHARLFLFVPMRVLYWPFMLFPIKNDKVLFVNFNGRGYGCNPKYICKELLTRDVSLDIVWMTKDKGSLPKGVRNVNIKSFRALYEFATAHVWVSNNRLPYYFQKKFSQKYLHTWHGDVSFKHIEAKIPNMPFYYKLRSKHDSKMIDLLQISNEFARNYFGENFWYNGEMAVVGQAANDIIINQDTTVREKVYDYYGLPYDTKIFLYAPTFRQNTDISIFRLPYEEILQALTFRFGGRWVAMVRLHPILQNRADLLTYTDKILNGSTYPDIQELICASDFMVSDYSGCIFDYMLSRKPSLFYAPDISEYSKERGFRMPFDWVPGPISETINDLLYSIRNFDDSYYQKEVDRFFNIIGINASGHASEYLADWVLKQISL